MVTAHRQRPRPCDVCVEIAAADRWYSDCKRTPWCEKQCDTSLHRRERAAMKLGKTIVRPFFFAASLMVISQSVAGADQDRASEHTSVDPSACPKPAGAMAGPIVRTKATAKAIYVAIARDLRPKAKQDYKNVAVEDAGSSWEVGDAGYTRVREFKDKAGRAMESVVVFT